MKVVVIFLLSACVLGITCGGNCPSGNCPSCLCGSTPSPQSISYWCSRYNWNQACCQCIVSHESSGNANAINYEVDSSYDVGLWQINQINWLQCSRGNVPCAPQDNLQCAINLYTWAGGSFKLWSAASICGCN